MSNIPKAIFDMLYELSGDGLWLLSLVILVDRPVIDGFVTLTLDEYANAYGLKTSQAKSRLQQAANELYHASASMSCKQLATIGKVKYSERLLSTLIVGDYISFRFNPYVIDYCKEYFKTYGTSRSHLRLSRYARRLYEYLFGGLSKPVKAQTRTVSLQELRDVFGLADDHQRMCDFKRDVLDNAVKELNGIAALSRITINYQQLKQGRNITHFVFNCVALST